MQETPTGVHDRLLLYGTSENAARHGISGPCLKMLRFLSNILMLALTANFKKLCVIVLSRILALRELHVLLCVAKC